MSLLRGSSPIGMLVIVSLILVMVDSCAELPVSTRLSLSYLGCNVTHTLAEDEVFVVRPFEQVLRLGERLLFFSVAQLLFPPIG